MHNIYKYLPIPTYYRYISPCRPCVGNLTSRYSNVRIQNTFRYNIIISYVSKTRGHGRKPDGGGGGWARGRRINLFVCTYDFYTPRNTCFIDHRFFRRSENRGDYQLSDTPCGEHPIGFQDRFTYYYCTY